MNFLSFAAGIGTAFVMYHVLFSDRDDFWECVRFWLTPDLVSLFRGEYFDDHWGEFKLLAWVGCSIFVGYAVSTLF